MNNLRFLFCICLLIVLSANAHAYIPKESLRLPNVDQVKVEDAFWSPKFKIWTTVTANDVLDKFEGKYVPFPSESKTRNAFDNFDRVAAGERDIKKHDGPEWYDGLVYETIRGISDLLASAPDKKLEDRLDAIIEKIYAAQQTESTGYINTHTQLMENGHRWGYNGGILRGQHDVYNAGMLVDAGIHYYKATGKTKLLSVATRFANYMADYMGPLPKKNIVPAHSGPEEALMKLYWLYRDNPELKQKVEVPVNEKAYYDLTKFWIETRGVHCGYPLWAEWGYQKADRWIRDAVYQQPEFGPYSRPTWGAYSQDSIPVLQQKTIEGHAVRATLMATGLVSIALENHCDHYIATANDLWDNMIGKRMFINGGAGAIHHDEKFGPDFFLPNDAYLETCAAVGAGFFSQRMNQLSCDSKHMDELERSVYNNVLTGISASGNKYTYINPLNGADLERWEWHVCPCCPPMFLKMVSVLPSFIYGYRNNELYVNLFIGSETTLPLSSSMVKVKQETGYPWKGNIKLTVNPGGKAKDFVVKLRVPGWAQGIENPYGLYRSDLSGTINISVNGKPANFTVEHGYATLDRSWQNGDVIEMTLPVEPRFIYANNLVDQLKGKVAIGAGPLIYTFEDVENANLEGVSINVKSPLKMEYKANVLGGVNLVKAAAVDKNGKKIEITAIPYYSIANRKEKTSYATWVDYNR